jgi:hypothetical protein
VRLSKMESVGDNAGRARNSSGLLVDAAMLHSPVCTCTRRLQNSTPRALDSFSSETGCDQQQLENSGFCTRGRPISQSRQRCRETPHKHCCSVSVTSLERISGRWVPRTELDDAGNVFKYPALEGTGRRVLQGMQSRVRGNWEEKERLGCVGLPPGDAVPDSQWHQTEPEASRDIEQRFDPSLAVQGPQAGPSYRRGED